MASGSPAREWMSIRAPSAFLLVMSGLIGLAWAALLLWQLSPYGRYLDHGRWTEVGLVATICGGLQPMLFYAGGWLLMLTAMMLPTTLPLLQRFQIMVSARADQASLVGLLIAGYLIAWTGFGVAAHGFDQAVHLAARHAGWLTSHAWLIGATVLLAAGAFQFTELKYRCLTRCRAPLGFIVKHWHGVRPRYEAFRLGLDHGVFCVGCCWALMLLMFVVGMGNVGWMLLLGAVMALEKNATWGRRLTQPLGAGLIGWAALIVAANLV